MFDFSFAELALVVVVAVIFIGPKELPVVVRTLAKALRGMKSLTGELRQAFDDLSKESGLKDIEQEMTLIKGDDGKFYEAYDLTKISPPSKGEDKGGG